MKTKPDVDLFADYVPAIVKVEKKPQLKVGDKIRMYYPRFVCQYGFWEMPWIDTEVTRLTRKKHNPCVELCMGREFIFDKKTFKCCNFPSYKTFPKAYTRYIKLID